MSEKKGDLSQKSGAYERAEQTFEYSFGTERRVAEVRGLRSNLSRVFYDASGKINVHLTAAQSSLDGKEPVDKYLKLFEAADRFLRAKGEMGYSEASSLLGTEPLEGMSLSPEEFSLLLWQSQIVQKYGSVSQEALAARFIWLSEGISRLAAENEKQLSSIFSFSEAWHEWQSEIEGEHLAAVQSTNARSNLRKSGSARTAKKDLRLSIVAECAMRLWQDKPLYRRNASGTAACILGEVNEKMRSASLNAYTEGTLVKKVGDLIRLQQAQTS
ncbi:hypothetical protein [Methylobacterium oxalidis]|uniref:Uncharacterized protein n=1 Tax=Methylobacterium oxalidis TaxID=944322 RepID=A0A512J4D1_9HYPH|nr:hypothetical protein [Methylobacterium oxalidis]GEP04828.1 hypothetical protein MOX02_28660 [Methylobacterium oxalidis]GLS63653.1 hypothetical protein GCM10007888_20340 [Methylobacterium oxalidis]